MLNTEGQSEAIILVKAAPQISHKYGDTLCCMGVSPAGEWVRLYLAPEMEAIQQLGRWSRIRFKWRTSQADPRPESRDIDPNSVEIVGELSQSERHRLVTRLEVMELHRLVDQGKSLALLRPRNPLFFVERKSKEELTEEQKAYDSIAQRRPANSRLRSQKPCTYKFKYKYSLDDGDYEGTCHDWGIDTAFTKLSQSFGEAKALMRMIQVLGKEYPEKGMVFAVGTHSSSPQTWFINAIISTDEVYHMAGQCADVVA